MNFLKTRSIPKLPKPLLGLGLALCALLGSAAGEPRVEWVSPPAWLETRAGHEPAQPGTLLTAQTWITTGRAGKALVRLGHEQVELDENSMWEWQGQSNGSTGNALQGKVRVGTFAARALTADGTAQDGAIRLYVNAPWTLVLDVGEDAINAQRVLLFLRRSGYPVRAESLRHKTGSVAWQLLLDGFMSSAAALTIGGQLMGLAPGIASATYQPKPSLAPAKAAGGLRFSEGLGEIPKP